MRALSNDSSAWFLIPYKTCNSPPHGISTAPIFKAKNSFSPKTVCSNWDSEMHWWRCVTIIDMAPVRPGRTAIKDRHRAKKQYVRKQHDYAFRLVVVMHLCMWQRCRARTASGALRVVASTTYIQTHIAQTNSSDAYGPASRRYWAINHARQPDGTPVVPPATTTFSQLQSVDSQQRVFVLITAFQSTKLQEPEFIVIFIYFTEVWCSFWLYTESDRLWWQCPHITFYYKFDSQNRRPS